MRSPRIQLRGNSSAFDIFKRFRCRRRRRCQSCLISVFRSPSRLSYHSPPPPSPMLRVYFKNKNCLLNTLIIYLNAISRYFFFFSFAKKSFLWVISDLSCVNYCRLQTNGYYVVARRHEVFLRVLKNISRVSAASE